MNTTEKSEAFHTGKLIAQMRIAASLTQQQLGEKLKISKAAISQLEARDNCKVVTLTQIAKICKHRLEINFKPLKQIKMPTQKINYFFRDIFNQDNTKYGVEYIYFPEILAAGMPEGVQAGYDPSNGNDGWEPSNDIWNQTLITRCDTLEAALAIYEEE